MEKVFAALDSDVRRQILVYLSSGPLDFRQIKARFPFSGPALLYHLRMLEEARFIEHRGKGRSSHYALLPENVERAFFAFLADIDPPGAAGATATGSMTPDPTVVPSMNLPGPKPAM